jgi:hypothetical protein
MLATSYTGLRPSLTCAPPIKIVTKIATALSAIAMIILQQHYNYGGASYRDAPPINEGEGGGWGRRSAELGSLVFCLLIRKVYYVQYCQHGRPRCVGLGEHGRLTPEETRIEAKKLLGDPARGLDPIAARKAARSVPLFREISSSRAGILRRSASRGHSNPITRSFVVISCLPSARSV